jgi:RecA/RadA recombinase
MAKKRDLTEIFVQRMKTHRPKTAENGTFDFAMSDEEIFGDINYVLLTGNEPYDDIVGGFPFGRISEVFGLENCGKSAMMIRSMCRFQAKHIYRVTSRDGFIHSLEKVDPKNIRLIKVYIDNEGSLEKGFKLRIIDTTYDEKGEEHVEIINMDKTGIGLCDTIEHVFLAADEFLKTIRQAEKENEEEENEEVVFGLFICDTIAATSSKDEIVKEWGKKEYPKGANLISEGFRRLRAENSRHNTAMIFTNQVRTKFNTVQGHGYRAKFNTPQEDDHSTYGGKALSFYASHRVFMFRLPVRYTLVKGAQFPDGYLVGFRTTKNRLRKPMREARMVLLLDETRGGLDNSFSILESLCFLKVAKFNDGGAISFQFRKFGIETTTFAENVKPGQEETLKARKKLRDPEIEMRYQWPAFHKAHRSDIEKLWKAAIKKANSSPLDEFFKPDEGEDPGEDEEVEQRSAGRRQPTARIRNGEDDESEV